ncbi:hypothetical protein KLF26_16360 (plasmid) [Clostridium perfringens]|uniref:hypothetical protein n=1 Tax=Clostridium perfringens TaxID=1502 RepID=UPI001CCEACC2|nr:hypothetical protein [Clostridium perfringens]UBL00776.1 hypothetical protein KLF26_16360 [Clostridium perfringens]
MNIAFENILEELNISEEILIEGYNKLLAAKSTEEKLGLILYNIQLNEDINKYYFNKIFNENYCISIEDIAKHLDVTIRFVMQNIVEYLDRIEFPNKEYAFVKKFMKMGLRSTLNDSRNKNIYGMKITDKLKQQISSNYRKKVLYSMESYLKFLQNHMELIQNNTTVCLELDENYVNKINQLDISNYEFIKIKFEEFIENNKSKLSYDSSNVIFDFKKLIHNRFGIDINDEDKYLSDFKSTNSLKVLFNKVYDIEVQRELDSADINFEFNLNIGSKKKIKRYLLSSDFLVEKVKENFLNREDINYETKYNFKIQYDLFYSIFNGDVEFLNKEFIKYVKNIHN